MSSNLKNEFSVSALLEWLFKTASLEHQEGKSFASVDSGFSVWHFLQIGPALNHLKFSGKDKGKVQATKAQMGSRIIALFFP